MTESSSKRPVGCVYLVGAGPGDPGLITVRGEQLLRRADLVLYDGLVNPLLLRATHASAERTCRVSSPDGRHLPQEEINQRLIDAARLGKTVVRLKQGDPFIFGRGTEEAAALAAAGIPYEVVPGITAATAAAVYAGLSLTHREFSSAVAFITGHEDPTKTANALDYAALAQFPGTLVFYMGLHRLPAIAEALIEHGKPASTPVAVISKATLPVQRIVTGTLANISSLTAAAGLKPPSLVVVGNCVELREKTQWFEQRPLFGRRIGITRAATQADETANRALELGAQPLFLPTIQISPPSTWEDVDEILERLDEFDWLIFTSVNGVNSFFERLWATGRDLRSLASAQIAVIGSSTGAALEQWSLRPDLVPQDFRGEALAAALGPLVAGKRVLWVRASRGRDVLPEALTASGAELEQIVVYQNEDVAAFPPEVQQSLCNGEVDWIGLSSPSIARNLKALLPAEAWPHVGTRLRFAAISPVTASAAAQVGLPVAAVAKTYTWEGLFEAIIIADNESSLEGQPG